MTEYKRTWHNLRVSRITELVEKYPAHVVNAWMGNTEAVSVASYRKVTAEHFTSAARVLTPPEPLFQAPNDTGTKAEIPAEQAPKPLWKGVEAISPENEKPLLVKGFNGSSNFLEKHEMEPAGVEPASCDGQRIIPTRVSVVFISVPL